MAFTKPNVNKSIWRAKPDVVRGKSAEVKADFDRLINENSADLAGLIGELEAPGAAASIGSASGTVQAALDARVRFGNDSAKYIRVNSDKVLETSADGTAWDKARGDTREYTATISAAWSGSAAPYTQTVTVSGITAEDMPEITPEYASVLATAQAQEKAWGQISYADTGVNAITFTCLRYKPAVAIPIKIRVVK